MWNRIAALIVKELLATLRDKRARVVLIGPPLVQMFIFSFAATLEVKNVDLAILNDDAGKPAHELVQRFAGSPTFSHIRTLHSSADIRPAAPWPWSIYRRISRRNCITAKPPTSS